MTDQEVIAYQASRIKALNTVICEKSDTIEFLAILLAKTMAQRDRARDTAVTLEQLLAMIRQDGDD